MAKARKSVLEVDRGGSSPGLIVAATTPLAEFGKREADRRGLAELDQLTEASTRLTRAQKDRERILPRPASQALNQATLARVPELDEIRTPVSGRQMKVRSKVSKATQAKWTGAQVREMDEVLGGPAWGELTDQLSENVGDLDALSERDKRSVQRIDRAIRQYEEHNDRQHHVYANVQLPAGFDASELLEYEAVHLDRWAASAHNLHEVSGEWEGDSTHVLEITTRRGMYMGHSDGGRSTAHLLPRGMGFRVVEVYEARWRDRQGQEGRRKVLRLEELEEGQ